MKGVADSNGDFPNQYWNVSATGNIKPLQLENIQNR